MYREWIMEQDNPGLKITMITSVKSQFKCTPKHTHMAYMLQNELENDNKNTQDYLQDDL